MYLVVNDSCNSLDSSCAVCDSFVVGSLHSTGMISWSVRLASFAQSVADDVAKNTWDTALESEKRHKDSIETG